MVKLQVHTCEKHVLRLVWIVTNPWGILLRPSNENVIIQHGHNPKFYHVNTFHLIYCTNICHCGFTIRDKLLHYNLNLKMKFMFCYEEIVFSTKNWIGILCKPKCIPNDKRFCRKIFNFIWKDLPKNGIMFGGRNT